MLMVMDTVLTALVLLVVLFGVLPRTLILLLLKFSVIMDLDHTLESLTVLTGSLPFLEVILLRLSLCPLEVMLKEV